jgi:hypothetical protein
LGPSNWVPRPKGRGARQNPAAPAALPAGEGVGIDHMLTYGWLAAVVGGEVACVGARRWPAVAAAAGRFPVRGVRTGGNVRLAEVLRVLGDALD